MNLKERNAGEKTEDGCRFEFGKNWALFLSRMDEERIVEAENSLKAMLMQKT